jgi:hypothetical protein
MKVCIGTLFFAKHKQRFFAAYVPSGQDDAMRFKNYERREEAVVAKMLYRHGYIHESEVFNLVSEGEELKIVGIFPATLIYVLLLGPDKMPKVRSDKLMIAECRLRVLARPIKFQPCEYLSTLRYPTL